MQRSARAFWRTAHRWAGLFIALFLIMSGLTGAVISWDHEIDEWLNADLFVVESRGPFKAPLDLAKAVEASDPRIAVSYIPLGYLPGESAGFFVRPRTDPASGGPYRLDFNQVFVDPVTARVLGQRDSRAVSLSTRNLMPFLHRLHYTLQIPSFAGTDRWGYWLMGAIALVWLFDSFVGFYLTLPSRQKKGFWGRWKPAWLIRRGAGGYKLNFDLHRAFGLWTWALIFVVAFTSASLNLRDEIFYPIITRFSPMTPSVTSAREPAPLGTVLTPKFGFAQVIDSARAESQRLGWTTPMGGAFYNARYNFYNVSFFDRANEHGNDGMGLSNLYLDGDTAKVIGDTTPWRGTAADVFMQLQLPLHSGRILGLPGQIMMSAMGLIVALLSVTGLVIWIRKRRARALRDRPRP